MRINGVKQQAQAPNRRKLMAQVHMAATSLGIEHGSEAYRDWLEGLTGKRSCKDLSDSVMAGMVTVFRQHGLLDKKLTGSAPDRPSLAQWRKMETLARQLGFGHAMTPGFAAWVKKVSKVESPRFLTSKSISDVIVGLERWLAFKNRDPSELNEGDSRD